MLDVEVAEYGDDAPAGHVEVGAEQVAIEKDASPDVEWKNQESKQVDGSCHKRKN